MYYLAKTFKTSVLNSLMSTETHKINEIRKTIYEQNKNIKKDIEIIKMNQTEILELKKYNS